MEDESAKGQGQQQHHQHQQHHQQQQQQGRSGAAAKARRDEAGPSPDLPPSAQDCAKDGSSDPTGPDYCRRILVRGKGVVPEPTHEAQEGPDQGQHGGPLPELRVGSHVQRPAPSGTGPLLQPTGPASSHGTGQGPRPGPPAFLTAPGCPGLPGGPVFPLSMPSLPIHVGLPLELAVRPLHGTSAFEPYSRNGKNDASVNHKKGHS